LKKAQFFKDIFSYDSVVSIDAVRSALTQRAVEMNLALDVSLDSKKCLLDEIIKLYENFGDFLGHLKGYDYRPRKTDSLWSTYMVERYGHRQYIREDYVYGVAHWSSGFASKELSEYRGSWFGRPVKYHCCNEVKQFYTTRPLKPESVALPLPGVPMLEKPPSEYLL